MLYRTFGNFGWNVSALALGCWNLGNQYGKLNESEAGKILYTAVDCGINIFDIADVYGIPSGLSELRIGKHLHRIRHELHYVTKIGKWCEKPGVPVSKASSEMIRLMAHSCLGRLRTDYIDILLCHEQEPERPEIYIEGFERLKHEGSIRGYGISTDSLESLKTFHRFSDGGCEAVEVGYSMLNRTCEEDFLPFCMENNIAVLVKRPLEGGILTGKFDETTEFFDAARYAWNKGESKHDEYLDKITAMKDLKSVYSDGTGLISAAIQFVLKHEIDPVAIIGATRPDQIIHNCRMLEELENMEAVKV